MSDEKKSTNEAPTRSGPPPGVPMPPAVSDTPAQLSEDEMWVVVESVITTAVAYTPSPSDALQALAEALIAVSVGCDVSLRDVSAYIMKLHETQPPTDAEVKDARDMIYACWQRAQQIKGRAADVKTALEDLKKKREQQGACSECGRSQMEHSSTNSAMLRSTGIIVCDSFKSWNNGAIGGQK